MHLWYGNMHLHIWMMTKTPEYTEREYGKRGWCEFERRTGAIITPSHMCIDLGLVEEDLRVYHQENWFWAPVDKVFAIRCSASRELPMTPGMFEADILPKLQFT